MAPFIIALVSALSAVNWDHSGACQDSRDLQMGLMQRVDASHIAVHQRIEDRPKTGVIETNAQNVPHAVRLVAEKIVTASNGFADVVDFYKECEL